MWSGQLGGCRDVREQQDRVVEKIFGIIGGFHLISSTKDEIQTTLEEVKALSPHIIVPTHCTGFPAIVQFATKMPNEFVLGVVGTTYLF